MTLIALDHGRGLAPERVSTEARWSTTGPITLRRATAPAAPEGLGSVDRCLSEPGARGLVYVEGPVDDLAALERHLGRRGRATGRTVVSAGGLPAADAWREIARKLGVAGTLDPRAAAREIAARAERSILLVLEGVPAQWGRMVASSLEQEADAGGCLVMVLTERAPMGTGARILELGAEVFATDVRTWFEAIVADPGEPSLPAPSGLRDLESWWAAARATPAGSRAAGPSLDAAERQLLDRLALSQRSWSEDEATRLGSGEALLRLLVRRVLSVDGLRRVVAGPRYPLHLERSGPASAGDAASVAELLESVAADDPWSLGRASELHAAAGSVDRADQAMARALALAADASVREDLWQRHETVLHAAPAAEAAERRLAAAERALRLGDVDRAFGFARRAVAEQGDTFAATWMLGRAACARGDLTTAEIALDKARAQAPDAQSRVRVAVERAEVRYQAGAFAEAQSLAEEGLDGSDAATRLAARNVIGKLHLARGAWAEAEPHFAADAHDSACVGDVPAELRARSNRAIALMMMGRYDESRALLLAVVEDGERWGQPRAMARGLQNLAVAAHRRHDYGEAFQRYAEATALVERLGEKIPIANMIVARAELSVQLNLLPDAEQTLEMGRRACGAGIPGTLIVGFEVVAARVHLARGRTEEAAEAVRAAMKCLASAHGGDRVGECHLLATRIALEEGDLSRAGQALAGAREGSLTSRALAETALLGALLAQATGSPFAAQAMEALDLARQASSLELVLEAHRLLAHAHRRAPARGNLAAAAEIRDRMARGLPDDVRARFLARKDLLELARLEAAASTQRESAESGVPSSGPRERRPFERPAVIPTPGDDGAPPGRSRALPQTPGAEPARRIVGCDPAITSLRAAIQRIGAADGTVLIRGESGTGKELVAEAVHEASARRRGPLLKVNCAALVESLLLSELFGHEKGAFTGATTRRQGRFELADGGTLFLDEIGDISPGVQKSLLRVLQERTFERVGSAVPLRTDCRVICATHRDLNAMVARGEFREDLYYRLHGLVLQVPSLRKRLSDLPQLAATILRRIAAERGEAPRPISARALEALARHAWPGNVRELENALRAATLFAEGDEIELEDFTRHVETLRFLADGAPARGDDVAALSAGAGGESPRALADEAAPTGETPRPPAQPAVAVRPSALSDERPRAEDEATALADATYAYVRAGVPLGEAKRWVERECIAKALAETGGNITRAAERLGMKRSRLSQIVKQYGLGTEEDES